MKIKYLIIAGIAFFLFKPATCTAQIPGVSIVTGIIKKVIVAIDIKVQQMQNKTLILQNVQKQLENGLSFTSLNNISKWVGNEQSLFTSYYDELKGVKAGITAYSDVKNLIADQLSIIRESRTSISAYQTNGHFSTEELSQISGVFDGITSVSISCLDNAMLVLKRNSFTMTDYDRLRSLHESSIRMEKCLSDLRTFNQEFSFISTQRALNNNDRDQIKTLYNLK